ncbi:MAG: tRNA (adenosine(37)-N6)-threonylcarbamoyltransferase complex dimerization subunit type 1 TsaB [Polyangiaceae bacterium]|nr:tRNA (adenosine(37)-N6)-threonylcarbamoyltransferase complex dimerization subunit type 1 TsaB [Polyangiaceae bacterium]
MKLLALTTSTRRSGAAVLDDERLLGAATHADETSHAERLFALADEALARAGLSRAALDAVACDVGPGSFTGVRVALASAQAVAFALGRPLVGVESLRAMAGAAFGEAGVGDATACATLLDARRGETFLAVYDVHLAPLLAPRHVPNERVAGELERAAAGGVLAVAGEHARSLVLEPVAGLRLVTSPATDLPDAAWVARLALAALRHEARPGTSPVEAVYLRPPDAKPMAPP